MSYQVLARKWRPQKFTDVVGQEHVLTALANGLEIGRVHHAYLFSGTRGVGKTTIARLIAKGLNCETGVTAKPCGECVNCREIEQGRFVDLLEIDAASRTKVEDTRELLDNVQYAPVRGRFKVYLIDEVHMLSRHSFNALLKTLEEPPEHVKFLLATTDPQKLPITILSRCLQFNLRALDIPQISHQLEKVLTQESIPFEAKALQLLARAAQGSMRDALSLTDQAIASGNNHVIASNVSQMLGMLDDDQPINIAEAIINAEPEKIFSEIERIRQRGSAWAEVLIEVSAIFHQISLLQMLPKAVAAHYLHHEVKLRDLARRVTPADLQIYYQIMLIGRKELVYAPDAQMGVEMALLRALAFHPQQQAQYLLSTNSSANLLTTQPASANLPTNHHVLNPQTKTGLESTEGLISNRQTEVQFPQASQQLLSKELSSKESAPQQIGQPEIVQAQVVTPALSHQTSALLQARQALREKQEGTNIKKTPPAEQSVRPVVQSKLSKALLDNADRQSLPQTTQHLGAGKDSKSLAMSHSITSNIKDSVQSATPSQLAQTAVNDTKHKAKLSNIELNNIGLNHVELNYVGLSQDETDEFDEDPLNYQWRAQNQAEEIISMATPKQLRQAIEQDKTPEVLAKMAEIACERDEWAKMVSQLQLAKLTEQLALNSIYQSVKIDENKLAITLRYRSSQKHLVNQTTHTRLSEALTAFLDCEIVLDFEQNDNKELITPHEVRQQVYAELLDNAKQAVFNDEKLQKICAVFDAQIDESSIKPV